MTHYRAEYRAAAALALRARPEFAWFTQIDAWAQKIDPSQMPCFGIATPRETSTREGGATVHRVTILQVAAKIAGGPEIEEQIDGLSLAAEAAILAGMDLGLAQIVALASTATSIEGSGKQRVATLMMEFTLTRMTDAGAAS